MVCVCVCVCLRVNAGVYIQRIYDGMGPRGEAVPCEGDPSVEEEEGEATCLLAEAK